MRRFWLPVLLLVGALLPLTVHAEENALTPAEVEAGWLLLYDGSAQYGWSSDGAWSVSSGAIEAPVGAASSIATTTDFADFVLHADCWSDAQAHASIQIRSPRSGDRDDRRAVVVTGGDPAHPAGSLTGAPLPRRTGKTAGRWSSLDVTAEGGRIDVRVDGSPTAGVRNAVSRRGAIVLQSTGSGVVRFRNIRLRPLGLKSIFDGSDMSGWVSPPSSKAVYSITPEGWLNVKGARGDLQTQAEWGDFALQLDAISNGEHCNSGIFYRAEKGKFELGYEDQIRNEWEGDDRTMPVDYGTGAIYNRQPVRRVVSSDHEWFTMTLIAHGTHFGSWVNGIMVGDFTDSRPPDQSNARKGARTKAGVISIQGHDTNGDLSFRRIRITALPREAPQP